MKFKEKTFTYTIPCFLEFISDHELIKTLEEKTNKTIVCLDGPEGTYIYKLCAISLDNITSSMIEQHVMYNLINLISNSELDTIKIYSIEAVGVVLDKQTHRPMMLFITRGIL